MISNLWKLVGIPLEIDSKTNQEYFDIILQRSHCSFEVYPALLLSN